MGAEKRARDHVAHTRVLARIELFFLLFLSYRIKRQQVLSCSSIVRERYTRFELCHIIWGVGVAQIPFQNAKINEI